MDRRADLRHSASATTVAATDFARMPSRIADVSRSGCRIATPARLRTSERVGLELPAPRDRIEYLTGCVMWSKAQSAGIAFDGPLDADLLTRLADGAIETQALPCDVIRLDTLRPRKR